jgi:hypothetical protein
MHKFLPILAMMVLTIMATTLSCSTTPLPRDASEIQYEVLSPWADVDPIPVRGISPRVDTLAGKKIGLFANFKRAAKPIQSVVERRLKERFPDCETSLFDSTLPNVTETETENKDRFTVWAKDMDTVIAAVGD